MIVGSLLAGASGVGWGTSDGTKQNCLFGLILPPALHIDYFTIPRDTAPMPFESPSSIIASGCGNISRIRRRAKMIDDYAIKKAKELMSALDSSGMKEMLRAIEDHKRAFAGINIVVLRDAVEKANYLKNIAQVYGASEQISKAMLDLSCASQIYSDSIFGTEAMRLMTSVSDAWNRRLTDSVKAEQSGVLELSRIQAEQMSKLAESIKRPEWLNQIRDLSATVKGFELASFESRFASFGRIVEQAEASMRSVRWGNIAALKITPPVWSSLEFRTEQLSRSFVAFAERIAVEPKSIVTAPPFVSKLPPLAVYSHAEALKLLFTAVESEEQREEDKNPEKALWDDARDQTLTAIETLLPQISSDLMVSWKGGWITAHRKSPDWARQAAASFRYVLTTVLDMAAPSVPIMMRHLPHVKLM
jgi:hypothetical protein